MGALADTRCMRSRIWGGILNYQSAVTLEKCLTFKRNFNKLTLLIFRVYLPLNYLYYTHFGILFSYPGLQ